MKIIFRVDLWISKIHKNVPEFTLFIIAFKSERNSRNSSYIYFSVPHIDENQIVRLVEELLWLSFELMLHFEIPYYFNEPS